MAILRVRLLPQFPRSAATFLETETNFDIKTSVDESGETSEYIYFGLEDGIKRIIILQTSLSRLYTCSSSSAARQM